MNNEALKMLGCCEFSEHTSIPALTTFTFETNYLKLGTRQICQSLQLTNSLPTGPCYLRCCWYSKSMVVAVAPNLQLSLNLHHEWGSRFPERAFTFYAVLTQLKSTIFPWYKKGMVAAAKVFFMWPIRSRTWIHLYQPLETLKNSFFQKQKKEKRTERQSRNTL